MPVRAGAELRVVGSEPGLGTARRGEEKKRGGALVVVERRKTTGHLR